MGGLDGCRFCCGVGAVSRATPSGQPAGHEPRHASLSRPVGDHQAQGAVSGASAILAGVNILDACCGSRMFWFDRQHPHALYIDKRCERHSLTDASSVGGSRELAIEPDMIADFTKLPFPADSFALVVFDPPHLIRAGAKGWLAKKYGKLGDDWKTELRRGFAECFRVLRPEGVLVFKWNENDIPLSDILALTPERPLFGNRGGKAGKSHWVVFMKPALAAAAREGGDVKQAPAESPQSGGEAVTPTPNPEQNQ